MNLHIPCNINSQHKALTNTVRKTLQTHRHARLEAEDWLHLGQLVVGGVALRKE
jgi:hypothetical protein